MIQLIKVLWCVLRSLYVTDCWRPFLSSRRWVHLEQSSSIYNSVAISAEFWKDTEDWTVSEIVYDQQFSVKKNI